MSLYRVCVYYTTTIPSGKRERTHHARADVYTIADSPEAAIENATAKVRSSCGSAGFALQPACLPLVAVRLDDTVIL